jgi:hypothetical protein
VKKNAELSDLQVATSTTLLLRFVQFSFGERMKPLLNCSENKEYKFSGSYIEKAPQAAMQHQ